jgi:hypothetical protein
MSRRGCSLVAALLLVGALAHGLFAAGLWGPANLDLERPIIVPIGASHTAVARQLE